MSKKIEFDIYVTDKGESPFREWLDELPIKDQAKMLARIQQVEEKGIPESLKMQWIKKLRDNIWEIRSWRGGNHQRACYFHVQNGKYLITHGFTKKTDKTPPAEIDKAQRIQQTYIQEQKGNDHAKH